MAAASMVVAWESGADTRQRHRPVVKPASSVLSIQRKIVFDGIRARDGGYGIKQKHMRHARSLFEWLDVRNQVLDAPNTICWAGEGVQKNTDTYADRLRLAQWACEWNGCTWVLPKTKRAKKPEVKRPFVDHVTDSDLEAAFLLIKDKTAETFFRAVAATGCRPGEVALFDWKKWDQEGRPQNLCGYSPKVEKQFIAICNPLKWIQDIDIELLAVDGVESDLAPISEETSQRLVRHYSKLLKLVKRDLENEGWRHLPTWTDLRHMWTIRAELDGFNRRIAAISQAHSHKMAEMVYLRHGERRQVLAEIKRRASMQSEAA